MLMKQAKKILAIYNNGAEDMIEPVLSLWTKSGYLIDRVPKSHLDQLEHELKTNYIAVIVIQPDNLDFIPLLPPFISLVETPILILPYKDMNGTPDVSELTHIFLHTIMDKEGNPYHTIKMHDDMLIDVNQRKVFIEEQEVDLTKMEFELISLFVSSPKHVFTYEMLFQIIWSEDYLSESHVIHSAINRLREKFRGFNIVLTIENVHGVGYRFIPPGADSKKSP